MNFDRTGIGQLVPGLLVCIVIALAATFLSEHYGGPQLLYALLMGLSLHFLSQQESTRAGIGFCGKSVLRVGVALLGIRITYEQVADLGLKVGLLLVVSVAITVGFGLLLARWLNRPVAEGLLSGGSVGICGASAAMAISSVLPPTRENERFTLLAVVGVTLLSTTAMVIYPFLLSKLQWTPVQSGIFLGATIHDVAQVVAAGMIMGEETANAATIVKLFRVLLLMPVVLLIAFAFRRQARLAGNEESTEGKMALVPTFLIGFVLLVIVASTVDVPEKVVTAANAASRWCLVVAIAAAGVKTSLEDLKKLGWQPVLMLVAETLLLAAIIMIPMLAF